MKTASQPATSMTVFDRMQVRRQRQRAARRFAEHDVLFQEAARHLDERLQDVARDFARILHIGDMIPVHGNSLVVSLDNAVGRLHSGDVCVAGDEELLPFAPASFDAVVSNLTLHWVNDLPGALVQIRRVLRPDGLFLAALLGGATLTELRQCLMDAELTIVGGISPRLSPTIDLQTASGLLQRAGFSLPVADMETYELIYPDALALMRDLRGMGEGNAHQHRLRHPTRRAVLKEAARLYQQRFAAPAGGVTARFDILFLHGWSS